MEREILRAAAQWHAQFCSGEATDADRLAWSAWLNADPGHRRAWARVEALQSQLQQMPGSLSANALRLVDTRDETEIRKRRAVLKSIGAICIGGGTLWLTSRHRSWEQRFADYRTGVGERREWRLSDGSRLMLNTASAADVTFDEAQRLIRLQVGEILIETAKDPAHRPLLVRTAHGTVRALGTRFVVRVQSEATTVVVLEHAVEITAERSGQVRRLQQGERLQFTADGAGVADVVAAQTAAAWTQGMLIVSDRPLGEVVAELARYSTSPLHCDSTAASLRISGAFPVDDVDRALSAMTKTLPVRLSRRQGIWGLSREVRVELR